MDACYEQSKLHMYEDQKQNLEVFFSRSCYDAQPFLSFSEWPCAHVGSCQCRLLIRLVLEMCLLSSRSREEFSPGGLRVP